MWTAEDYVSWWLSPEGALAIWWVGFFGVAMVVLATRRIRWSAALALALFVAIAGQSLAFAIALMAGANTRAHGGNPSDAFAAGAVAGGFAWLPAIVVVAMAWRRGRLPEDAAPVKIFRSPSGVPMWLLILSGAIGIAIVGAIGFVLAAVGGLFWILARFFDPALWEWRTLPLAPVFFVLSVLSLGSVWLLLQRRRQGFRTALLFVLPSVWGIALIGTVYVVSTARLGDMGDGALVRHFVSHMGNNRIARAVLVELRSRSRDPGRTEAFVRSLGGNSLPRGSGFARALRALRELDDPQRTPSARLAIYSSDKTNRHGDVVGWSFWIPYEGRPERDLLAVAIARGELEEPRAWASDPNVSPEIRSEIKTLLAEHARK